MLLIENNLSHHPVIPMKEGFSADDKSTAYLSRKEDVSLR